MAIDRRYGRVTLELGDVGTNEPVVVFAADDELLPELLTIYIEMARNARLPERIEEIAVARDDVVEWQETHPTAGGRHHLRVRDGD